jgi:thioesterase domain-containing protein
LLLVHFARVALGKNFGGLEARPYIVEPSAVPFDLSVTIIEESNDTWWICTDYRTDLFPYDQINCRLDHYVRLLGRVVERPELRFSELERPGGLPVARSGSNPPAISEAAVATQASLPADTTAPLPAPSVRRHSSDITQEVLADLWAKVLGTRPLAATSNFFDVGGHSLLAVYLASEISSVYGTNFPVSAIFQEPTIERMARRLQVTIHSASCEVAIHDGGSLPPFFCGGPREVLDLSRALGSDQPFFQLDVLALQQQRLFTDQALYTSVPSIAARFLQDILSIQPSGPYFLGGMCEGGITALEIALQLQAGGREVALVAQFDTPVNGYWRKRPVDWVKHCASLISARRLVPKVRELRRARLATSRRDETRRRNPCTHFERNVAGDPRLSPSAKVSGRNSDIPLPSATS